MHLEDTPRGPQSLDSLEVMLRVRSHSAIFLSLQCDTQHLLASVVVTSFPDWDRKVIRRLGWPDGRGEAAGPTEMSHVWGCSSGKHNAAPAQDRPQQAYRALVFVYVSRESQCHSSLSHLLA